MEEGKGGQRREGRRGEGTEERGEATEKGMGGGGGGGTEKRRTY